MIAKFTSAKFTSGFCEMGQHEGSRPRSVSGKPMKVCVEWQLCLCSCHAEITEMYEISGIPREIRDNPEYRPYVSPSWMLSPSERKETIGSTRTARKSDTETGEPIFVATKTGRSAPGQLEYKVRKITDAWTVDSGGEECTVKYIMSKLDTVHSNGAVDDVLRRWARIGYCDTANNPFQFVGLTVQAMIVGLEGCKEKANHDR